MFKKLKHKIDVEYKMRLSDSSIDDFDLMYDDSKFFILSLLLPSYIFGFVVGLVKKKKIDFRGLKDDSIFAGLFKSLMYFFILGTIVFLPVHINPSSRPIVLGLYKATLILFATDNFLTTWLTLPLFYLLGRDAKKGISTIKKKSKEKKELLLEQKKELEKELAKDYIVSPEVMEYTKSNRTKEIDDYKKLREEYVPSVEVVHETQKVIELK